MKIVSDIDNIKRILISMNIVISKITIIYHEKWQYFKTIRSSYIGCSPHRSSNEKNVLLFRCLIVLRFSYTFRESGRLFQIVGAKNVGCDKNVGKKGQR